MKNLYLLRHSKAGQTNKNLTSDHARKLTSKGITYCDPMGNYLKKFPAADLVLSSTATRAFETAEYVFDKAFEDSEKELNIEQRKRLYLASPAEIIKLIGEIVSDDIETLAIVGHNPGMQQLAIDIAGKGDIDLFRTLKSHFPPPSIAIFELDITNWSDLKPQSGNLIDFKQGKSLT